MHSHITQYEPQRERLYVKTTRLATYLALHELTDSYLQAEADGSGVWLTLDDSSPSYVDPYYWTVPEIPPTVGGSSLKYLSPVSARSPSAKAGRRAPAPSTSTRRETAGKKAMKNDKPSSAKESDDEFLARIRDWWRTMADFEAKVRAEMLDDLKFVRIGGVEQWPTYARDARNIPGQERPMLTDNRIKRYRTSVINQIRQNTPSIKVRPVDDSGDGKVAEILQGVIRNIENVSRASNALDKAVEYAVDCGRGYFGIHTKYVSDDTWDQDIAFRLISDPFRVYYDCFSIQPDGSDAKSAMIVEDISREQFERDYPGVELQDWAEGTTGDRSWLEEDSVRVAEFFELIETPAELVLTVDGRTVWADDLTPEDQPQQTRKTTRTTCGWWKIAGNQILEQGELPCSFVPIIPVFGEEWWNQGQREICGLVRAAKPPQQLLNFWLSAVAEQVALQPKVPWVGPAGAFEGFEEKWSQANSRNFAFLEYEPTTLGGTVLPAPSRQAPPPIPSGYVEQINFAVEGIRAAVGMEDPSVGRGQGPDQSGRAIRSLQEQGAVATFHFSDNLSKSVAQAGRIILQLIPSIYDTRRVLRILGEDGEEVEHIEHDPQQPQAMIEVQEENGEVRKIYNLAVGKYDVVAVAGPSYTTKRQESFDAAAQLIQGMPQLGQLAGDLILRNWDAPGADLMADRLKAALPPQILAATEGDDVDPQMMAAQQQLQQMQEQLMQLQQQLQLAADERGLKEGELQIKSGALQVQQYEAETKRMALLKPEQAQAQDPQEAMRKEFDLEAELAKLTLLVEEGERKQEAHERAMREPFPVPASNTNQGGAPITGS
jgi:Phage P22-like portal protein